jgi:hypothetical protein
MSIAQRFEHYISDYLKSFKQKECAVYRWEDRDNRCPRTGASLGEEMAPPRFLVTAASST